uniref:SM/Sec1-family protein n=1 Tax=Physcomitrium patens TaxID=3218 RepID=A0A7I4DSW6_PHYPA
MALSLRQKQLDAVVRMLNLNHPVLSGGTADEEVYKVLIYDNFCRDILSPLIRVNDLRKHGITLYLGLDKERQNVPDVPAIYFVQPLQANIQRIILDASRGMYEAFHLNFSSSLPRPLLEELATNTLRTDCLQRIAKDVEAVVENIANGLFSVLATLGVVPVIRCASGGPAEMVASALDSRIRDHLVSRNNLFTEAGHMGTSFQRPVLCLFDRNFELSVAVQHVWSYRPLVHDVLNMRLNRVTVQGEGGTLGLKGKNAGKTYELDDGDSFWVANGNAVFPQVAQEVEVQLSRYKQDIAEVNKKTGGDAEDFDEQELMGNTKHLMNAVNSLPELTERKRTIDKHTNIATALLGEIKNRSLDSFSSIEDEMLSKGSVDRGLIAHLKGKGSKKDKLRLAVVYLLAAETTVPAELEAVEAALRECEVDPSAFLYVKRIKSLNVSLSSAQAASKSNLGGWGGQFYEQALISITAGVKNLLSGGRQAALIRVVEALMESKPSPETDSYLTFDPRAPKGSAGAGSVSKGPFKEAIVFMIGGGNYLEYGSLQEFAKRQQPTKNIIYGTTEILSGEEFIEQLAVLGRKMGVGGSTAASSS